MYLQFVLGRAAISLHELHTAVNTLFAVLEADCVVLRALERLSKLAEVTKKLIMNRINNENARVIQPTLVRNLRFRNYSCLLVNLDRLCDQSADIGLPVFVHFLGQCGVQHP